MRRRFTSGYSTTTNPFFTPRLARGLTVGQLQIYDRLKVIFWIVPSPYPLIRCMMSGENSGQRTSDILDGSVRGARKIGKIKEEGPPNHLKNPGDREK